MQEKITNFPENPENEEFKILRMNPKQLGDYFKQMDEKQASQVINKMMQSDEGVAFLSYWEKYLDKDKQALVDKAVHLKQELNNVSGDLPLNLDQRFSDADLKIIFQKLRSIQLSYGCSKGCKFCGFDAVAKVRQSIRYEQLNNLFQKYGTELALSRPFLYYASEPSDYNDQVGSEKKTYQDVHRLAEDYANYSPHITSVKLSDDWVDFVKEQTNRPRLSVFKVKDDKIDELNSEIGHKVQLIGKNSEQYDDIGKNYYNLSEHEKAEAYQNQKGIGCFNGFLLTPRGLYNVCRLKGPLEDFPQGQMVVPFREFKDVEIKIGDNFVNLLPYYAIDLSNEVYFGNNNEACLVLRKKSGGKIILFIDGEGTITRQHNFNDKFKNIDRGFVINHIIDAINNDKLIMNSGVKMFSGLSVEEIMNQLKTSVQNIKSLEQTQIVEGLVSDDQEWDYVVTLSPESFAYKFFLDTKKENNEKILFGLTFYFNVLNGELKKTFLYYDSPVIFD